MNKTHVTAGFVGLNLGVAAMLLATGRLGLALLNVAAAVFNLWILSIYA